jgi:hypothetical protein
MTLDALMRFLQSRPATERVAVGFAQPHGYLGGWQHLAFVRTRDSSIGDMTDAARKAAAMTYADWKTGAGHLHDAGIYLVERIDGPGVQLTESALADMLAAHA